MVAQHSSRIKWMSGGALAILISSFMLYRNDVVILWKSSSAETTNTKHPVPKDPFQLHPECALLTRPLPLNETLDRYAKYVPARYGPRYDHTCFILKPRYNCARTQNETLPGDSAYDYALALKKHFFGECHLQQFVHDSGGPAGVARRILENFRTRNPQKTTVEVVFLGSSHFRQIWESLVCSYGDQMSDFWILKNNTETIDLNSILNRTCHQASSQNDYQKFYRNRTVVPQNYLLCNDNVARAEFTDGAGSTIRFSYVFRPWEHKNTSVPFEKLGIPLFSDKKHPLDFVFWEPQDSSKGYWKYGRDADLGSLYEDFFDLRTPARLTRHHLQAFYRNRQLRDLGRWFGADNPWITRPPDHNHGCMPGMPDDEANILLWYMLSLSAMKDNALRY